jgi:hypothetical protein
MKVMTLANGLCRTLCWIPTWSESWKGVGLEHLVLTANAADSVVLAIDDEQGPLRLQYRLNWDDGWRLQSAELAVSIGSVTKALHLETDGQGRWRDGHGDAMNALDGCLDIDIWPTPFTNSFPIRRSPLQIGERREFRMAWVSGPDMTVHPQSQAYTRLSERLYLFESLDGSGFKAELPVDEDGFVLDYPELFQRVKARPDT